MVGPGLHFFAYADADAPPGTPTIDGPPAREQPLRQLALKHATARHHATLRSQDKKGKPETGTATSRYQYVPHGNFFKIYF
jgi:hypothetical protein